MKRIISIFLLALSFCCYAGEPHRGYRGYLEWETAGGEVWYNHDDGSGLYKEASFMTGLATSHGFQFNRHVYVGAGTYLAIPLSISGFTLPVYGNFRYDATFGKAKPYGDVRLGYDIIYSSIYFSPSVGYRVSVGKKSNFNVGVGISLRRSEEAHKTYTELYYSLRLGIDF